MKKNKAGGISLPGFKLYYKTTQYGLGTKRRVYQRNRIESPEIKHTHIPHIQPINSPQRGQEHIAREEQSLQQMVLESWTATCTIIKLSQHLTPHTKTNPKWIEGLHVKT